MVLKKINEFIEVKDQNWLSLYTTNLMYLYYRLDKGLKATPCLTSVINTIDLKIWDNLKSTSEEQERTLNYLRLKLELKGYRIILHYKENSFHLVGYKK